MAKKFLALTLALIMVFALCACGKAAPTAPTAPEADAAEEVAKVDYPTRTITVIVPFGAGGDTDLAARIITDKLSQVLGCTVVVENVSGGSGVIGHTQMLAADPDGYTLMINQLGSHVTQTQLGNTTYNFDDSTVIAGLGSFPQCFVVPANSEWETFQDMIDWAKANPGKLTYGTQGVGGLGHTCALDALCSQDITAQDVAFGNTAESVTAVLGGHVMMTCCPVAGAAPYINSGELKLLALSNKFYLYPDAPVVADFGCPEGMYSWIAVFGPGNMDQAVVDIISSALEEVMADATVAEQLKNFGIEVNFVKSDDYKAVMDTEFTRNHDALLAAGLIEK